MVQATLLDGFLLAIHEAHGKNPDSNIIDFKDLTPIYRKICHKLGRKRLLARSFVKTLCDCIKMYRKAFIIDHDKELTITQRGIKDFKEIKGSIILLPKFAEIVSIVKELHRRENLPFDLDSDETLSSKQYLTLAKSFEKVFGRHKRPTYAEVCVDWSQLCSTLEQEAEDPAQDMVVDMEGENAAHDDPPIAGPSYRSVTPTTPRSEAPPPLPEIPPEDVEPHDNMVDEVPSAGQAMPSTPKRQLSRPESFYQTPPESNRRERMSIGRMTPYHSPSSPSPPPRTLSVAVGRTPEPDLTASELARKDHEIVELRQEIGELRDENGQLQQEKSVAQKWYQILIGNVAQAPSFFTS